MTERPMILSQKFGCPGTAYAFILLRKELTKLWEACGGPYRPGRLSQKKLNPCVLSTPHKALNQRKRP